MMDGHPPTNGRNIWQFCPPNNNNCSLVTHICEFPVSPCVCNWIYRCHTPLSKTGGIFLLSTFSVMQHTSGRLITFFMFFIRFSIRVTADFLLRSVWVKRLPCIIFTFFHTHILQLLFHKQPASTLTSLRSVSALRITRRCRCRVLEYSRFATEVFILAFFVREYDSFLLSFSRWQIVDDAPADKLMTPFNFYDDLIPCSLLKPPPSMSHSFFPSLFSHLPLSLSSPSLLLSLCVFLQRPPAFERHTVLTYRPFQPYAHEEREPQVSLHSAAL